MDETMVLRNGSRDHKNGGDKTVLESADTNNAITVFI